jgi:sensor histidine kinase regulating citrate/malate metabolism
MYELARLGKTEDLKSYAAEFMEKTDQSLLTLHTGNQELDILLYSKLDQARQNLVEVDIHNSEPLHIHNKRIFNVIAIISNLLDNAIEACMEIDNPDDRSITLSLEQDLFNYYLIVTNTFDPKVLNLENIKSKTPTLGITHKKDKKAHGMGLKIVQSLVQRLEGKVQIDIYNQQFFQIKVTLPAENIIQ